ncbi:AAA family ATPase, partial [Staphylococcus aureus]
PEVSNLSIRRSYGNKDDAFDLFYEEQASRNEREIAWAGDGIQIWLQELYHMWMQRAADVIILDEPDVFLHPDLQRRLART